MACVLATFRTSMHIKGEGCTCALASARFNLHYAASFWLPLLLSRLGLGAAFIDLSRMKP
jgi:hypothetical protein